MESELALRFGRVGWFKLVFWDLAMRYVYVLLERI